MKLSQTEIRDLAVQHAKEAVKAMAVAQRMGMMNSEEELVSIVAAGIETAIEDFENTVIPKED
jgi:stage V sporulation protein SpoVS